MTTTFPPNTVVPYTADGVTYDVDFTPAKFDADGKKTANARITVRHNGVVIHDDVEVPKATRAAPVKEGPGPTQQGCALSQRRKIGRRTPEGVSRGHDSDIRPCGYRFG